MTSATAILSLLHQGASGHSAFRPFRGQPVLSWTLKRLEHARRIDGVVIVAWDDQLEVVRTVAASHRATVISKGPRTAHPKIDALSAALRWSDGWRGGLLGACPIDQSFDAPSIKQALTIAGGDVAILVDPDSALIDPQLLDALVSHADSKPTVDYVFMPAAPGLSGVLLRPSLLDRMEQGNLHPGRLLNYYPDLPGKDPLGRDECAPVPVPVARTIHRFDLCSNRQIARIERAAADLNGQLMRADAEELVHRMNQSEEIDDLPGEVELELTTTRATRPVFSPATHLNITRPDLSLDLAKKLFAQLADSDDVRLTLTGVGDPLLHPQLLDILRAATESGIKAIHLETDLLPHDPDLLPRLVESSLDLLSVHVPATSVPTYAKVMGIDALAKVMENLSRVVRARQALDRGTPLLVPTFVKCRDNLHEMEAWYDHWLMAFGSAVITGPGDFANLIPRSEVADMTPPRRRACRRLSSRMTILSTGQFVSCSQDVTGRQVLGNLHDHAIRDVWSNRTSALRSSHATAQWDQHPLCAACREWHRP